MTIIEKKTAITKLANDAKTLYAEMESDESKRTPENREKLDKMITDGKSLRKDLDTAEDVKSLDEFANTPAAPERKTRESGFQPGSRKTYGQAVVGSEQFKNANHSEGKMKPVEVGDLITRLSTKGLYNTTDAQGGFAVRPDRETEILDIARQRPFTIMDLINVGQTSVDAVEYILFTTRTNNAAVVDEWLSAKTPGAGDFSNKFGDKPQGDMTLDLKTAVVKTIAEWIPASRQILNDAPNLRSMIDNELMYQIEFVLENQIVAGSGSGNNFTGMLNTAGIQTRAHKDTTTPARGATSGDKVADTLRRAITDISLAFYEADGIILNPSDGENLELDKGSDGHYVQIFDPVAMRVWRKPVREVAGDSRRNGTCGSVQNGGKTLG